MNALILSAGLGTRLYPLTKNKPKCLIKVSGDTMLDHWINKLLKIKEVKKIFINTHYFHEKVLKHIKKKYSNNKKINIIFEKKLLGTLGTLNSNFYKFKGEELIVIHCDNYMEENLDKLIKTFKKRRLNIRMTLLAFITEDYKNVGIIKVDQGKVVGIYEKKNIKYGNLANGAIYILDKKCIFNLFKNLSNKTDFSKSVIPFLQKKINYYTTEKFFVDIGNLANLKKTRNYVYNKKIN